MNHDFQVALLVVLAIAWVFCVARALIEYDLKTVFINGTEQFSATNAYTYGAAQELDFALASGADGTAKAMVFALAAVKFIYILSDQDVVMYTNADGGSGGTTISLKANIPLIWRADGYVANPFVAADVTASYWDNLTSGQVANIKTRILIA